MKELRTNEKDGCLEEEATQTATCEPVERLNVNQCKSFE